MVKILSFGSFEEMLDHILRASQEASKRVDPFLQLEIGDFFIRLVSDFVIYGEVLDPSLPAFPGDHTQADLFEMQEDAKIYAKPHMKDYRFTRCFSPMCPEGELGDVHISTVQAVLTEAQFKLARSSGWPQDPTEIRALLNVQKPSMA